MKRTLLALLLACTPSLALTLSTGNVHAQGRSGAETEEEEAFQAAEKASDDEDAAKLYDRVIALNANRAEAYVRRAAIDYRRKDYAAAVALLRRGEKQLPDDLAIKAQLGLSLYNAGQTDEAVRLMELVVERNYPLAYQVEPLLGEHYLRHDDGKKAAAAFEAYFRSRPDEIGQATDAQLHPYAGGAYLLTQQWPLAQKEFELALKANPNDQLSRAKLATAYMGSRDYSKAITSFEKLLPYAPKQPAIYYNLAGCYLQVNRHAEAQHDAEAYAKVRPKDPRGFILLGQARTENRDYPGALAAFQQALALAPQSSSAQAGLGRVFIAQKNYVEAMRVLETAHRERPDDVAILTQLAEAYAVARAKDHDLLVSVGGELGKAAGDVEALTASGLAYFAAGEDELAERSFQAAMAVDARAFRPRAGLQLTLNRMASKLVRPTAATGAHHDDKGPAAEPLAQAEELLLRAQKLDPDSVHTNRNLGLVLLLEKKLPEAEKPLELALKKVPRDFVANRLLGRVYSSEKRRDDALKAYQAAEAVALRGRGAALAQLYVEMGPLYLDAGQVDQAVTVLETAVREGAGESALAAQRNLALAYYRRGTARLKDAKAADGAYEDLAHAQALPRGALSAKEATQVTCALAVAALKANKLAASQEAIARAQREGGCTYAAPYDKVGLDFFAAYGQYRDTQNPARREQAARTFSKLLPKAPAQLAETLHELLRSSYELEGYDWFVRGDERKAAAALRSAQKVSAKGDARTLDHNLAVVDLDEGRLASAEKVFGDLGVRPAEALVNLGIVRDRQGDSKKALDLYKKAWDRGVHAPKLREWIDVKERILSGGGGR